MKTMFIGIAGGSGSGKTTLTRRLKERYPRQIAVSEPRQLLQASRRPAL